MRGLSCSPYADPRFEGHHPRVRPRRVAIVMLSVAAVSGSAWALVELGRSAEPALVPPIVVETQSSPGPDRGHQVPGGTSPEPDHGGGSRPGGDEGSGGDTGGATPPPAPPPPSAGDDDERNDDGGGGGD